MFIGEAAKADFVTVTISSLGYGWANNPDCNLDSGAGLPAAPFGTGR